MRDSEVITHVGKKKTGKTTENLNLIRDFVIKQEKPVIVFDSGNQQEYAIFPEIQLEELRTFEKRLRSKKVVRYRDASKYVEFCNLIDQYVKNAVILFEDSSTYITPVIRKELRKLLYNNRNAGLDIIFVFHGISLVPNEIIRVTDKLILRETNDDISNPVFKSKIYKAPQKILTAMDQIKKENASKYKHLPYKAAYRLVDLHE